MRPARPGQLFLSHAGKHTDNTCRERMSRMVPQMADAEGINEALKVRDPMAWVGRMNSIHQRAEETILAELIYV